MTSLPQRRTAAGREAEMLVESIAILMIMAVMVFIFLRAHKRDYAISTVPLLVVPFLHAVVCIIGDASPLTISPDIRAAADVLGLAISVAMLGMFCVKCKTRKAKYGYLFTCGGFITVLTMIFIYNTYIPS